VDGKLLAAAVFPRAQPEDRRFSLVRVWNVAARARLHDITSLAGDVRGLSFAADGTTLAVAVTGENGLAQEIELWNAADRSKVAKALRATGAATGPRVAFARRAPLLALTAGQRVEFYVPPVYDEHPHPLSCNVEPDAVALTPDGSTAAVSLPEEVVLWDTNAGGVRWKAPERTGTVYSLAFTADGRTLISGGDDRTVREWNLPTG
jgi:WD40 repeat protein